MYRHIVPCAALALALGACGGNQGTANAPGAPTILSITPGDASATVAFGPAAASIYVPVTSYTATCTASGPAGGPPPETASGSASPLTLSPLANGVTYVCYVTATNFVGTGPASASVNVIPGEAGGGASLSIDCSYSESTVNPSVGLTSESTGSCAGGQRLLSANGIPDHAVGTFPNPNNPNAITAQTVSWFTTTSPAATSASTAVQPSGYALNGVKFDPGTGGTCPSDATNLQSCTLLGGPGDWHIEALAPTIATATFDFGTDSNNAHVQPGGAYHYHAMPEGILTNNGVSSANPAMLLLGFAQDGFPIYARYGHTTANDASSALKVMTSSYQVKTTLDSGRPPVSIVPAGTFTEDWEYVAGSGDLDECNGRFDVTPDFPQGIYHYYITDNWPYIQRCVFGTPLDNGEGGAPPP